MYLLTETFYFCFNRVGSFKDGMQKHFHFFIEFHTLPLHDQIVVSQSPTRDKHKPQIGFASILQYYYWGWHKRNWKKSYNFFRLRYTWSLSPLNVLSYQLKT